MQHPLPHLMLPGPWLFDLFAYENPAAWPHSAFVKAGPVPLPFPHLRRSPRRAVKRQLPLLQCPCLQCLIPWKSKRRLGSTWHLLLQRTREIGIPACKHSQGLSSADTVCLQNGGREPLVPPSLGKNQCSRDCSVIYGPEHVVGTWSQQRLGGT